MIENYICWQNILNRMINPLTIIGAFLITLALLSYGISCIAIQRFKLVTPGILIFLTLGVVLDLAAVTFMYFGSDNPAFSYHSLLGFSALFTMLIDMVLIWKHFFKKGFDSLINNSIILYSKFAYAWWLLAYITGSLLVIWPKN